MVSDQISRLFDRLQKIQQCGDLFEEGNTCFKIGVFLRASGDLVESSKFIFSALQLAEESSYPPLCIKSCEELVRIFAFLKFPLLSQYYFNRILFYSNCAVEKDNEIAISFSYLLDILNHSRILNSNCICSFFLDIISSSIDTINSNRYKISENRIELDIFLKALKLLGNHTLDEFDSESLHNLLIEEPKSAKLHYYSLFINGYYHKKNRNYKKSLDFFEKQLKTAKELRDFHLILFSYYDLMECHFFLEDFDLYQTTYLIIKDLVKGKKEFEEILLKGKFFDSIIDSLETIKRPIFGEHNILTLFLVSFFRRLRNEQQMLDWQFRKGDLSQLFQVLPKNKFIVNALETLFEESRENILKQYDFTQDSFNLLTLDYPNPLVLRFIYWNLSNNSDVLPKKENIKSKLLGLQNTKNLLILNELIKIFNLSKLDDANKLFERFCFLSNVNLKNPLEGFDYFAFRRPSKKLSAMVSNFNMKSKSQSMNTGLTIPQSNFLPSPTFFGPEWALDDEECDLNESFNSCSIHDSTYVQPTFLSLRNVLRVLDLCCCQQQIYPSFNELKSLAILKLSIHYSTLLISSTSLEEIVLNFCDLESIIISNCGSLKSVSCNFSKIGSLIGIDPKVTALIIISSEIKNRQSNQSTKKPKTDSFSI